MDLLLAGLVAEFAASSEREDESAPDVMAAQAFAEPGKGGTFAQVPDDLKELT